MYASSPCFLPPAFDLYVCSDASLQADMALCDGMCQKIPPQTPCFWEAARQATVSHAHAQATDIATVLLSPPRAHLIKSQTRAGGHHPL